MKILIVLGLFMIGALLYTGCNPSSSTPPTDQDCGDAVTKGIVYDRDSLLRKWPDNFIADTLRVYNLWIPVDSICSKEHINSFHQVRMFPYSTFRPFYFKAAIEWSIFFSRTSNGTMTFTQVGNETQVEWIGEVKDVGMAQSFGEGPADVFINIYVSFRTFGNAQQDSLFFVQRFFYGKQLLTHKFHKSSPTDEQGSTAGKKERFKLAPGQDRKTFFPGFFNEGKMYKEEINNHTKKPSS
jgi:hypothetical protein